jgi:L-fuculose-phosphate aldolase
VKGRDVSEQELREAICDVGRRLHDRGFVAAWDGNITARLTDGSFLCTPTMCCKGRLRPEELCVVDGAGNQLQGPRPRTSEILLHLSIYRHRPDVQAIVHSHAPHATAFAVSGKPILGGVLAEAEYFLGRVPTVPYTLPGTQLFADSVRPFLDGTFALILANHGAVTFGPSLELAWGYTEVLDAYCRVLLLAQPLGPPKQLSLAQIAELAELRRRGTYGT